MSFSFTQKFKEIAAKILSNILWEAAIAQAVEFELGVQHRWAIDAKSFIQQRLSALNLMLSMRKTVQNVERSFKTSSEIGAFWSKSSYQISALCHLVTFYREAIAELEHVQKDYSFIQEILEQALDEATEVSDRFREVPHRLMTQISFDYVREGTRKNNLISSVLPAKLVSFDPECLRLAGAGAKFVTQSFEILNNGSVSDFAELISIEPAASLVCAENIVHVSFPSCKLEQLIALCLIAELEGGLRKETIKLSSYVAS